MTIQMPLTYAVKEIKSYKEVREALPEIEEDWESNWLFLSTGGVHGSKLELSEVEIGEPITVLIVRPRLVSMLYGKIGIEEEEQKTWLSQAMKKTLEAVNFLQRENSRYSE